MSYEATISSTLLLTLATKLNNDVLSCVVPGKKLALYGVPRGGVHVLNLLLGLFDAGEYRVVIDPSEADVYIDDIIDSGETMQRVCDAYGSKPFLALVDKTDPTSPLKNTWVEFPWDFSGDGEAETVEGNITRILQYIGENPKREGLLETPARVAKAYKELFSGYNQEPASVLKTFEDGAEHYDQMVLVNDIPVYSACEHHMEPIFGLASIAYIPDKRIVGLSKLARLTDIFARRLQVQERLTSQIANALEENLEPLGVGVIIRARHFCMERRGINKQGHHTLTSALRGVIRDEAEARSEFLQLSQATQKL